MRLAQRERVVAFRSLGRVLGLSRACGSRSTWSHRCSGSPTGRVSPCSSPPRWRLRAKGAAATEGGGAQREPRAAALVLASDEASIEIDPERFGLRLRDAAGRLLAEQASFGLGFESEGREGRVRRVLDSSPLDSGRGLALRVETDAGEGEVRLRWRTPRALDVEFIPSADDDVTHFADGWRLAPDESIYGLTERPEDSVSFFGGPPIGEIIPREVGTLDRRGETIEMLVRPTVALYAPFYVSSAGYGLYVATTAPGSYDVGDGDPDALRFRFEAVGVPEQRALRYSLFVGAPAAVLDEYTRLTGRPFLPPDWAFRHWRWRGELAVGEPAELDGAAVNAQVAEDLRMYERFGIPAGVYLIDRPWSPGEFGFESFRWDEQRLPNPDAMLASLAQRGWKLALWSAAFAVGENLETARAQHYLAPGSDLDPRSHQSRRARLVEARARRLRETLERRRHQARPRRGADPLPSDRFLVRRPQRARAAQRLPGAPARALSRDAARGARATTSW